MGHNGADVIITSAPVCPVNHLSGIANQLFALKINTINYHVKIPYLEKHKIINQSKYPEGYAYSKS